MAAAYISLRSTPCSTYARVLTPREQDFVNRLVNSEGYAENVHDLARSEEPVSDGVAVRLVTDVYSRLQGTGTAPTSSLLPQISTPGTGVPCERCRLQVAGGGCRAPVKLVSVGAFCMYQDVEVR